MGGPCLHRVTKSTTEYGPIHVVAEIITCTPSATGWLPEADANAEPFLHLVQRQLHGRMFLNMLHGT